MARQLKVKSDALNVVEVLNRACELTEGKVERGLRDWLSLKTLLTL
jgi:hypothetical protein